MSQIARHAMPEQPANVRNQNFEEVALGYDEQTAKEEAARCLQCANPRCRQGCPVGVDIPDFIRYLKEGKMGEGCKFPSLISHFSLKFSKKFKNFSNFNLKLNQKT